MRLRICVVTGTRAEYGLLYWLLKSLSQDSFFDLKICVTGMHLSPEFGLTYKELERDGFKIDKRIESLLSSDSSVGISKSVALGVAGFADALTDLKPDLVIVLGDRYEILSAAIAAMIAKIPIAHCHGGESTEGVFDEAIRHSITKMSHLHFTATDIFRKRVIQLGEDPNYVFNVGALGIENINKLPLLDKVTLENELGMKFNENNILVTFHPVTLEDSTAEQQFSELLAALDTLQDTNIFFTLPNSDTDSRRIIELIREYVLVRPNNTRYYTSLGQLKYLSTIQFVDMVVGNSSSGLIEVPSFKKATINIGDRQKGRIFPDSVINCQPEKKAISNAIQIAYSSAFKEKLKRVRNPYGTGNSSELIIEILKQIDVSTLIKKKFHDVNFT